MKIGISRVVWMSGVFALPAAGCIIVPPHSHMQPVSAVSVDDEARTDIGLSLGSTLNASLSRTIPLGTPVFVPELRGQLGPSHAAFTPGLWIRTPGEKRNELHLGSRIGLAAGSGDLIGFRRFIAPWVGPSLHLQLASGWGERGAFSFSVGGEYTWPIQGSFDVDGDDVVIMIPGFWLSADLRVEVPIGSGAALVLGGGVQALYMEPAPFVSLGAKF